MFLMYVRTDTQFANKVFNKIYPQMFKIESCRTHEYEISYLCQNESRLSEYYPYESYTSDTATANRRDKGFPQGTKSASPHQLASNHTAMAADLLDKYSIFMFVYMII